MSTEQVERTPEEEDWGLLNVEQIQRTQALRHARSILHRRAAVKPFTAEAEAPIHAVDLVTIAQWIIDGSDPWPIHPEPTDSNTGQVTWSAEDGTTVDGQHVPLPGAVLAAGGYCKPAHEKVGEA